MRAWLVAAAAAYAAVGATFTSHSIPALVAVLIPGVAALVAVAVLPRPREETGHRVGARHRAWLVWAVCFGGWELTALFLGELSFSLLLDPVLEIYPLRLAGWGLWLSAGWLLVRR
ncbi:MAG: hypothetical protein GEV28_11250 [Actinophytocola sp.]|uniref:hypothetical protein n=1 Tax=Actinophytocola sp. TaxID=1872138 RepID=UPI0013294D99|nr:hypothetical protein [Actinophytocola sp.]MPZ80933.1 hypothetical protein [Actinophytocola sp.]